MLAEPQEIPDQNINMGEAHLEYFTNQIESV
jgi:hypothetical protein